MKSPNIGIMGTPVSSGNRGVLALGSSLASLCLSHCGADKVTILVGNRKPATFRIRHQEQSINVEVVNFRLSPKSKPNEHLAWIVFASILYRTLPLLRNWLEQNTPWIKAVAQMDFVGDVRGGDSFSDIYGLKRFLISFFPVWSVILVKGSIVHFPQTYGPYKSTISRRLAAFLLCRSSTIVARDTISQSIAQSLAHRDQQVHLSPDVAFSLTSIPPNSIESYPQNAGFPSASCIGINVNGLMYNGGYTHSNMFGLKLNYPTFLKQLVLRLLEEQAGDLWLIPHTYAPLGDVESDNEASLRLREQIPYEQRHRVKILTSELDQYEVKGLIGMCGFFIGSRMHACIAALSQGVPCVGVAYSMKFQGVFESVGLEDHVVDARRSDNHNALVTTLDLFARREEIRDPLREASDKARQDLNRIFSELLGVSDRTRLKRVGD